MKRIIISESQLKKLIESDFGYGLDYYEQNSTKVENQVKSYHSQVEKFYRLIVDLSLYEIVSDIQNHKQILEQHKQLKEKIDLFHNKVYDASEKIKDLLEAEDENVWYLGNPLYKKYDQLSSQMDDLYINLGDMISIYDNMVYSAERDDFHKSFQKSHGDNVINIEPSQD